MNLLDLIMYAENRLPSYQQGGQKRPVSINPLGYSQNDNTVVKRSPSQLTSEQKKIADKRIEEVKKERKSVIENRKQAVNSVDNNGRYKLPNGRYVKYSDMNLKEKAYTSAQALKERFRVYDESNFVDDYINPFNMIGEMAAGLGEAPLTAEITDSYVPYFTSVGVPLTAGALASLGTKNIGQFTNNLVNPFAGLAPKHSLQDLRNIKNTILRKSPLSEENKKLLRSIRNIGSNYKKINLNEEPSSLLPKLEELKKFRSKIPSEYFDNLVPNLDDRIDFAKNEIQILEDYQTRNQPINIQDNVERYELIMEDDLVDRSNTNDFIRNNFVNAFDVSLNKYRPDESILSKLEQLLRLQKNIPYTQLPDNAVGLTNSLFRLSDNNIAAPLRKYLKTLEEAPSGSVIVPSNSLSSDSYNRLSLNPLKKLVQKNNKNIDLGFHGYNSLNRMGFPETAKVDPKIIQDEINSEIRNLNKNLKKGLPYAYLNEYDDVMYPIFSIQKKKKGGPVVSSRGQWDYPGQETIVPTEDGRITMKNVPYPVYGKDETGFEQIMYPDGEYKYPGNFVYEIPMMQKGGTKKPVSNNPPIYVDNPNDPRLKAYTDSLNLYKAYEFQKQNYKPGYEAWLKNVGKSYPGGVDALRKEREKNIGKPLSKQFFDKDNKKSHFKNSIPDSDYDPLTPQEYPIINYYKSLIGNDKNYRIGMHNSPDLWHKNINPIGSYYDGASSPIYKKPVQPVMYQNKPGIKQTVNKNTNLINIDPRGKKGTYDSYTNSIYGVLDPNVEYEKIGESVYKPKNKKPLKPVVYRKPEQTKSNEIQPFITSDINEYNRRKKAYSDSLSLYNKGVEDKNKFLKLLKDNNLDPTLIDKFYDKKYFTPVNKIKPVSENSLNTRGSSSTRLPNGNYEDYTYFRTLDNVSELKVNEKSELYKKLKTPFYEYKKPVQRVEFLPEKRNFTDYNDRSIVEVNTNSDSLYDMLLSERARQIEIKQPSKYQMRGNTPVYSGPGGALIGMLDKNNNFYPDYQNTANRKGDDSMLRNKEALLKFLQTKGVTPNIMEEYKYGGEMIRRKDGSYSRRGLWDRKK